jgi:hypothetical protein
MRSDGGLDDNEIDKNVAKGILDDTDAAILKKMDGDAQVAYLDALLEKRQNERRDHPHL